MSDLVALDRVPALSEGSGALPAELLSLALLLLPLGQDLGVLSGGLTVLLGASSLERDAMTLALQNDRGDEALDLRGLVLGLLAFLDRQGSLDDVLADIVLLAQVEEPPDLGSPLGSETAGDGVVGEAGNLAIALLDDGHREDGEVAVDDAAANRLSLALTGAALTVAGVALAEEEADTAVGEDTLLHGEALLVVATGDPEDVALPLVAEGGGVHLHAHTLLIEGTNLQRIGLIRTYKIAASRDLIKQRRDTKW